MDYLKIIILFFFASVATADKVIPKVYVQQTVSGTQLLNKFSSVSGLQLATGTNDTSITPYVGFYYDQTNGGLYYSYTANLVIGQTSAYTLPVTVKHKVSYDSMADMIVYLAKHPPAVAASDPYEYITDFFFTPAEANPLVILTALNIILDVAVLVVNSGILSTKATTENIPITGTSCGGYPTPEAKCASLTGGYVVSGIILNSNGSLNFGCYRAATNHNTGIAFSCGSYTTKCAPPAVWNSTYSTCTNSVSQQNISDGIASQRIAQVLKGSRTSPAGIGRIGKALEASIGVVELGKSIYDLYKSLNPDNPSMPFDPGNGTKMPSNKVGHVKDHPDTPDSSIEAPSPDDIKTSAPPTKDIGTKTETRPDGTQTKTEEEITTTISNETIITEIIRTITEYNAQGSPTGTTTEHVTPDPPKPPDDPCAKDPTIIGCSHWGDVPPPEEIQTHEQDINFSPDSGDQGSCPADKVLHLRFVDANFSYEPVCQAAEYINPMLTTFAFIAAGYILFGVVRE